MAFLHSTLHHWNTLYTCCEISPFLTPNMILADTSTSAIQPSIAGKFLYSLPGLQCIYSLTKAMHVEPVTFFCTTHLYPLPLQKLGGDPSLIPFTSLWKYIQREILLFSHLSMWQLHSHLPKPFFKIHSKEPQR